MALAVADKIVLQAASVRSRIWSKEIRTPLFSSHVGPDKSSYSLTNVKSLTAEEGLQMEHGTH